jgi:hypothetical protein
VSKDAWIGQRENGEWFGGHDGPCQFGDERDAAHAGHCYDLLRVLSVIEACCGQSLAWEFREQENGMRLVGYIAKS